jgi:NitT/TauT family transport system ATP-binding protein
MIEVDGITKTFDAVDHGSGAEVYALRHLTVHFRESQFVSIVGPSGCGKSTLLHLIAGLPPHFPADRGQIVVDGDVIRGPGADRGMVFQEYAVFPWQTVFQNIEYPLKLAKIDCDERHKRCQYYVQLMGLAGFEDAYPHQLSGGMKQRVAVARALARRPKVLLMDEPFAAVDAQTRLMMQEELLRVWEAERTTVVFVTHSVPEAVFLADRVLVMTGRPGCIRADVEIDLARPRLWRNLDEDRRFIELQHQITALIMNEGRPQ